MKLITMRKLYNCLKHEWPTVEISTEVAEKAVRPINRMLEISKRLGL
jgi:quinolinate synthase